MAFLSQRKLLEIIDDDRVRAAIAGAEKRTSGEIRVSVSRFFYGSVRRAAEHAFERMKMRDTRDRNGILFFVVPSRRRFVVVGDEGIHAKVGQEFWDGLVAAMSGDFREGKFNEGLIRGIEECGRLLAQHFPYDAGTDVNELPDDIDFGNKE
ncbi:MAG TPA: TPM domain-containing protein [Candidatus Aminicenantes bacterium]|nr:TPM domain-containing protein [Candidatus Aminicenantes bacterium]